MDQIFDRFGRLLKSVFQDTDSDTRDNTHSSSSDPDMQEAWDDLNEFLKTGKESGTGKQKSYSGSYTASSGPSESLRRDYANLEVPFGAPYSEVKKAYKRLLKKHHPDRYASDPKKLKNATLICQKLGESYTRIKKEIKKKPSG